MNDIIRLALDANLLNYVDLETPRRYFICADADVEEVERFAALVAAEKDKEIKRLQDLLYTQLGELTASRAEKQMRGHIKEQQEQPR
jgi:hypothetical protein